MQTRAIRLLPLVSRRISDERTNKMIGRFGGSGKVTVDGFATGIARRDSWWDGVHGGRCRDGLVRSSFLSVVGDGGLGNQEETHKVPKKKLKNKAIPTGSAYSYICLRLIQRSRRLQLPS